MVGELLERISVTVPNLDCLPNNDEVDKLVRAETQTWDLGGASAEHLDLCLVVGIDLGRITFKHTPLEVQAHIAKWTALLVAIDDFAIGAAAVAEFSVRFHSGQDQLHPVLDRLAETTRRMHDFFHPHSAAVIVGDTVQGVSSMIADKQAEVMGSHPSSMEFLTYKRLCNGLGLGYSYCVWDKLHFPDLTTFMEAVPYVVLPLP